MCLVPAAFENGMQDETKEDRRTREETEAKTLAKRASNEREKDYSRYLWPAGALVDVELSSSSESSK